MLIIRLQKVGKIHTATFRVVVTQKTAGPRRKYLELLGNINRKTKAVNLNKNRILYWISKGAKPSDTLHNLLISQGVISGKKIPVHRKVINSKDQLINKEEASKEEIKTEITPMETSIKMSVNT